MNETGPQRYDLCGYFLMFFFGFGFGLLVLFVFENLI